jgi:hypothetical protein
MSDKTENILIDSRYKYLYANEINYLRRRGGGDVTL